MPLSFIILIYRHSFLWEWKFLNKRMGILICKFSSWKIMKILEYKYCLMYMKNSLRNFSFLFTISFFRRCNANVKVPKIVHFQNFDKKSIKGISCATEITSKLNLQINKHHIFCFFLIFKQEKECSWDVELKIIHLIDYIGGLCLVAPCTKLRYKNKSYPWYPSRN